MYTKVNLGEYFEVKSVLQKDKMNFKISSKENTEAIPFLGRSGVNNGIVDYVMPEIELINIGGKITIALDGSTGSTFYQHHDFCSGQNIWLLEPRANFFDDMDAQIALFLITTIRKSVIHYSWNLSLTKTRLLNINILLPLKPNGKVDIQFIRKVMSEIRHIDIIKNIPQKRIS